MKVLLGVSGGIAAYKSAELVRAFIKRGDDVQCVMTSGAEEFIRPMTLQVLSQNQVGTEIFDPTYESEIGHIELARWPDVVLIAPATANVIARMAHGMADDLLTTVVTATTAPVVVAPAMNTQMYLHRPVQKNMDALRDFGFHVVDPDEGELACKEVGPGRLPDAHVLVEAVDRALSDRPLTGRRVLVTAGPTREHLDPARFISNPSTGKMGFAVARLARRLGAETTLVTGPSELLTPLGVERVDVETTDEMHHAVMTRAEQCDFVVKAAAVCDWRPKRSVDRKQEKGDMPDSIELERTPDILMDLCEKYGVGSNAKRPFIIGFAAETHDVEKRGIAKMKRKGAHMLVANKIGGGDSTFGSDMASAYILGGDDPIRVEHVTKEELAEKIWREAVARTQEEA